jgi:hypothetical protein
MVGDIVDVVATLRRHRGDSGMALRPHRFVSVW